jgi:hypothetical protein
MDDKIRNAVKGAMEEDLFKFLNFAAIKARAGHLEPGETISMEGYDFLVAEDEEGKGIVVMIVLSRQYFENLAIDNMKRSGISFEDGTSQQRNKCLQKFQEELRRNLQKFQQIWILFGPGDDLTFEKAAYKRDLSKWRSLI